MYQTWANIKIFITTGQDLSQYLQTCKTCFESVLNGETIIHYSKLESIRLPTMNNNNHKTAIILNNECCGKIGHWVVLLIYRNQYSNYALYMDSLNKIRYDNPRLYDSVKTFSKVNKLKLKDLSFKMQDPDSQCCGFHVLHLIAKFCHTSFRRFYNYIELMKKNPVQISDKFSIRFVQKHYT